MVMEHITTPQRFCLTIKEISVSICFRDPFGKSFRMENEDSAWKESFPS